MQSIATGLRAGKGSPSPEAQAEREAEPDVLSLAIDALRIRSAHYRRQDVRQVPSRLDECGLHWVEAGNVVLAAGRTRVELAEGDLVLLPRALPRSLTRKGRPGAAARVINATFDFATPDHPLIAALPAFFHVRSQRLAGEPQWLATLEGLIFELESPSEGSRALVSRLSEVLIVRAMRHVSPPEGAECPNTGFLRGLHDPLLQPALRAMHATPGRGWTLERLGKLAGLSRSAFAAHFAATMGEPAMTYLTRWRMFRARALLRESELALSSIAEEVGYGSAAAFSLAFSREHATSPGAFRARARRHLSPSALAYRRARP